MMKVGCILVLYNPKWELTSNVIKYIIPQVDKIFISDNSTVPQPSYLKEINNVMYHSMHGNKGIASAQNEGLKYYINNNYDFVFFLDQDSIVEDDMVQTLVEHYLDLESRGYRVGGIGPRPINRQQNKEYRGSVKKGVIIDEYTTEVTEIISSASLISIEHIKLAGLMDDSLFIDGVDHEWCWRCSYKTGSKFYISEKTHLSHQLGEGDRKFLGKNISIPTPIRTYYQFRNYFILSRRKYVPIYWKLANGLKYIIKMFYYPIFIAPRGKYAKYILKGITIGIKNLYK